MRKVAIIVVGMAVVLIAGVAELIIFDNPKSRVEGVRHRFAAIPHVKLTHISDLTKQASRSITASIEVEGKGRIAFTGLSESSFRPHSHIYLAGIGSYGFRTRELEKGQEMYGYAIDVGEISPISGASRLRINSVQSAITNYDSLLALVANWPVTTNEWPSHWPSKDGEWSKTSDEEIHFADLPRGDYYFCLKKLDAEPALSSRPPGYNYSGK